MNMRYDLDIRLMGERMRQKSSVLSLCQGCNPALVLIANPRAVADTPQQYRQGLRKRHECSFASSHASS